LTLAFNKDVQHGKAPNSSGLGIELPIPEFRHPHYKRKYFKVTLFGKYMAFLKIQNWKNTSLFLNPTSSGTLTLIKAGKHSDTFTVLLSANPFHLNSLPSLLL